MDEQVLNEGNTGNANPSPEEGNQGASMPDANQQPAETDGGFGDLPEGVSERTKAEFEKLKASNKALSDKLSALERTQQSESVFDYLSNQVPSNRQAPQVDASQYSHLNQGQVAHVAQQFVDQYGNVDINRLNQALADANIKAEQAQRRASATEERLLKAEQSRQEREAYGKHSWLNPRSPDFDRRGWELTRDKVLSEMISGRERPLVDIADEISSLYKPQAVAEADKQKAVEDYQKTQTAKAQQAPASRGVSQTASASERQDLRSRTMAGDVSALEERLAAATKLD